MQRYLSVSLVLAAAVLIAADDPKKIPETIKGTWIGVEAVKNGKAEKPKEGETIKFTFTAEKLTVTERGRDEDATYKLDTTKTPATIDIEVMEGRLKIKGIVEIDGDNLKLCFAEPTSDERPKDFAAKEGSKHICVSFKREKK